MFRLQSDFQPAGDQPAAIKALVDGLKSNVRDQVLLGVTGSGKTFAIANVIAEIGAPALVMAPNKTLAAQLYSEFKQFFLITLLSTSFPTTIITNQKRTCPLTPSSKRRQD